MLGSAHAGSLSLMVLNVPHRKRLTGSTTTPIQGICIEVATVRYPSTLVRKGHSADKWRLIAFRGLLGNCKIAMHFHALIAKLGQRA